MSSQGSAKNKFQGCSLHSFILYIKKDRHNKTKGDNQVNPNWHGLALSWCNAVTKVLSLIACYVSTIMHLYPRHGQRGVNYLRCMVHWTSVRDCLMVPGQYKTASHAKPSQHFGSILLICWWIGVCHEFNLKIRLCRRFPHLNLQLKNSQLLQVLGSSTPRRNDAMLPCADKRLQPWNTLHACACAESWGRR